MRIGYTQAVALSTRLMEERGTPPANARLQAEILVGAELKGHPSHGLQRLPRLLQRIDRGLIAPQATGVHTWRSGAILAVDGQRGLGPVVAMAAIERLMQRVTTAGIALAAIGNSNHLGMLAHYVEQLAEDGLIGIAMSSSEALVHPFGGTRAMLGTNPIAIAVPTSERPMVLDIATSVVSMGKIHHHAANNTPIPEGWARNAQGEPTTDAQEAKTGAIAPFGDAKGYGLGIAIELLVAAMAGAALAPNIRGTLDSENVCNKGDVIIAIEPAADFPMLQTLSAYLDLVRASPPADPGKAVRVPGDGAALRRTASLTDGFEISPSLWAELNALALPDQSHLNPSNSLEGNRI